MLIEEFSKDPNTILKIINKYKGLPERQKQVDDFRYFRGDNVFISNVKKMYFSDEAKGLVVNPYKANEKIFFGFFGDMVKQKVFTLLDEPPIVIPKNKEQNIDFLTDVLGDDWGNALQRLAIQASTKNTGYLFPAFPEKGKLDFTVFESENIIEFVDAYTKELGGLYRFWEVKNNNETFLIVEVYDLEGISVFKQTKESKGALILFDTIPYQFIERTYTSGEREIKPIKQSKIPIIKLHNNEENESDLTSNIKSKIDAIDVVQSDFMNNLIDFADIFWIIKNPDATADEIQDWAAQIAKKKAVVVEGEKGGAEAKTVEIPYQARQSLTEQLKADLREEAGVINRSQASGVTATEIRFATYNLRRRVSEFEYWLHKATREIIDLVLESLGVELEYTLTFNKNFPDNATELLQNMALAGSDMSLEDRLRILKRVGLIENVDETKEALEKEGDYYSVEDSEDEERESGGGYSQ